MAIVAETIEVSYLDNQVFQQPHLRLLKDEVTASDTPFSPEYELASQQVDRFRGRVAIEGLQAECDAITELSELTDGQMRAPIPLTFDGYDLYGPDGRSLTETARKGLDAARDLAKQNGNLWFEVGRRSLELEEVLLAVDMVKNGKSNTMMVTTDFPSALINAERDIGGYNVTRKQALRRIITVNPETGKILLQSQTLDGSNRRALEAVDAEFGFQAEEGELLGQRRFLNLTKEEQEKIMDRTVSAYDYEMSKQFGGEWYAGRRPADYRNTYEFVCQQRDLIDEYKNLKLKGELTNGAMYDLAATINARFKASNQEIFGATHHANVINTAELQQEMERAGREARIMGQRFSACGSTFGPGGIESAFEQAGYGNKTKEELSWHGGKIKKGKCVHCNKHTDVGVESWCKKCIKC